MFQVGDEVDITNGHEAGESGDEFPQKMQSDNRTNGDLSEKRKRLR